MDKSLLLIIDVQKNFINEYTKFLIEKIDSLIRTNQFEMVAFTKFVNYENGLFDRVLHYKGCILESDRAIVLDTANYKIFEKEIYSAVNEEFMQFLNEHHIQTIYLCGIDTDACVMKTALDLFERNIKVKVLKDYCMSHSGVDYHNSAIQILEKLIGKENVI